MSETAQLRLDTLKTLSLRPRFLGVKMARGEV